MLDEDYYDDDGNKICDNFGNTFLVNDGTNIYDIESNKKFYPCRIEKKSYCEKLCDKFQIYWKNPKLIYNNLKESLVTCSWKM